jgi:hypothetical protein
MLLLGQSRTERAERPGRSRRLVTLGQCDLNFISVKQMDEIDKHLRHPWHAYRLLRLFW